MCSTSFPSSEGGEHNFKTLWSIASSFKLLLLLLFSSLRWLWWVMLLLLTLWLLLLLLMLSLLIVEGVVRCWLKRSRIVVVFGERIRWAVAVVRFVPKNDDGWWFNIDDSFIPEMRIKCGYSLLVFSGESIQNENYTQKLRWNEMKKRRSSVNSLGYSDGVWADLRLRNTGAQPESVNQTTEEVLDVTMS